MKKNILCVLVLLLIPVVAMHDCSGALPALRNFAGSVRDNINSGGAIVRNNLSTVPDELEVIGENLQVAWANTNLRELVVDSLRSDVIAQIMPHSIPSMPFPLPRIQARLLEGMNYFDDSQFIPVTRQVPFRRLLFTGLAACAVADCIRATATLVKGDVLSIPAIVGIYGATLAATAYAADKIHPLFKQNFQHYELAPSAPSAGDVPDLRTLSTTITEDPDCYICLTPLMGDASDPLMQLALCNCTKARYAHRKCYLASLQQTPQAPPCAHCRGALYFPQQKIAIKLRNGQMLTNF